MTLAELKTKLEGANLPVAYLTFPEKEVPSMPFIVFYVISETALAADNEVNGTKKNISVELYTKQKDEASEALVEAALSGIVWSKTEEYLYAEKCCLITYEIEVV